MSKLESGVLGCFLILFILAAKFGFSLLAGFGMHELTGSLGWSIVAGVGVSEGMDILINLFRAS